MWAIKNERDMYVVVNYNECGSQRFLFLSEKELDSSIGLYIVYNEKDIDANIFSLKRIFKNQTLVPVKLVFCEWE